MGNIFTYFSNYIILPVMLTMAINSSLQPTFLLIAPTGGHEHDSTVTNCKVQIRAKTANELKNILDILQVVEISTSTQ